MPDIKFDVHVWNNSDAAKPVEFEVSDRSSGVMLFRFTIDKADLLAALAGMIQPNVDGWIAAPDRLAHAGKIMQIATRDLARNILDGVRGSEERTAAIRAAAEADLAARNELDKWHEIQPNATNRGPTYTVRRYVTEEEAALPLAEGVRNATRHLSPSEV